MDFLYINEKNQEIELEYDEEDLLDITYKHFDKIAVNDSIDDAFHWLMGQFYKEATANISCALLGGDGTENDYFYAAFVIASNKPEMHDLAKQAAIDNFNRNL